LQPLRSAVGEVGAGELGGSAQGYGEHGLDLTVEPGIVYGLLGPNGAGKTTLIRILATLLRPDAGVVRVAGIDVRRDPDAVRTRIGLAGEYAAVDDHLTGRENVEMVGRLHGLTRRDARRRAAEALRRLDAADVIPTDVGLHKPTLDDVFLALTRHRPAGDTQHPAAV
jgi:ABC-type multidrug transport system ATPase subunit